MLTPRGLSLGDYPPTSLNATLAQLTVTLGTLSPDSPLYLRLNRAVIELNRTLQTAEELLRNIDEKPSSLIFSRPIRLDPEPRGAP